MALNILISGFCLVLLYGQGTFTQANKASTSTINNTHVEQGPANVVGSVAEATPTAADQP